MVEFNKILFESIPIILNASNYNASYSVGEIPISSPIFHPFKLSTKI